MLPRLLGIPQNPAANLRELSARWHKRHRVILPDASTRWAAMLQTRFQVCPCLPRLTLGQNTLIFIFFYPPS